MIKYLLTILSIFLTTISYYTNISSVEEKYKLDGLIIEYSNISTSINNSPVYEIKLYADKYITYGVKDSNEIKKVKLSDIEYNEIVNYAFSNRFLSLKKGLTDPNVLDGSYSSIILYANGKEIYSNGGDNVTNRIYNKLVNLLRDKEREE